MELWSLKVYPFSLGSSLFGFNGLLLGRMLWCFLYRLNFFLHRWIGHKSSYMFIYHSILRKEFKLFSNWFVCVKSIYVILTSLLENFVCPWSIVEPPLLKETGRSCYSTRLLIFFLSLLVRFIYLVLPSSMSILNLIKCFCYCSYFGDF